MEAINLAQKLSLFNEHYKPHIVAELNGQLVKLVKFQGPFVWHSHEHEDELFYVVKGEFTMQYRDRDVIVREGEFVVVPRGVEHCPVAENEVQVMLFEPATTVNTGEVQSELTQVELERI